MQLNETQTGVQAKGLMCSLHNILTRQLTAGKTEQALKTVEEVTAALWAWGKNANQRG